MYFRKRGAPVVLVVLVACLVMSFAQATFGVECTGRECSTPLPSNNASCSTDAISIGGISEGTGWTTVKWNVLRQACQIQDITVRYRAYRKQACSTALRNETYIYGKHVYVNLKKAYIGNLEPYTTYEIQIAANYREFGTGPWIRRNITTRPRAPPKLSNVRISSNMSRQLSLYWDPLTCDNVNGDFAYYRAALGDRTTNITNISRSSVTFAQLVPCTTYRLSLGAANHVPSTTWSPVTESGTTAAEVVSAEVIQRTTTSLSVFWDVHSRCRGTTFYYKVIYRQIRWDACSNHPASRSRVLSPILNNKFREIRSLQPFTTYRIWIYINGSSDGAYILTTRTLPRVVSANVSHSTNESLSVNWDVNRQCRDITFSYQLIYRLVRREACPHYHLRSRNKTLSPIHRFTDIMDLQPFATYQIWIWTDGASDGAYTLTGTTLRSAPRGIQALDYTFQNNQLSFFWSAPPCEDLHGPFACYNYTFMRANSGERPDSACIADIQYVEYTTSKLQACTLYTFRVQVVTGSDGERKKSEWITKNAMTPTRVPGKPRNIIASPSPGSVLVRWEAPNDSPCDARRYSLTHELFNRDMCDPSPGVSPGTEENITDVRHNIGELHPNSVYRVCVRGWNQRGYGLPTCVSFTTGVKAPSKPPKRVECTNSSYDSLTFTWNKPRCGDRNGPITQYEYSLNAHGTKDSRDGYVEGNDNGGTVTLSKLIPATTYSFKVRAENDDLPGDIYGTVEANTSKASYYPPRDVVVTPLNGTTAAVEWLVPYISDFNITGYRVECWQSGLKGNTSIVASYEVVVCGTRCSMAEKITGLEPATNHSIQVIAEYKYEERKSRVVEFRTLEEVRATPSRQNAAMTPVLVSIFVIIVVLLLIIAAMLYSRKTDRKIFSSEWFPISFPDIRNAVRRARAAPGKSTQMSNNRNRNHTEREQNGRGLEMEMAGVVSQINNHANQEMESNMSCAIYENMPAQFTKHQAIPVGQLLGYVARRNADGSNSLDEDFKSLPSQKLHSQDIAMKEENKEKNRFINILPYDHSRVKLSMVHGDPHSDYINASFIDGYKSPKKYIAAQGPNTASVDSFWRMVWQYDCRKIVMLTNLREANKKKCEKYWPAERESYGDIWMTMAKEEKNDHYTVRYFNLVCNNTGRDVVQYHYTSWPDMGVPEFSAHLMSFVRITREPLKSHHKGPTIVHCSAGVGRTGTFLTLDAMLDQVQAEQAMDIHSFITSMRQNRPLMVQTKKQYRFIYEALLQDQTCGDTGISRDAFGETYQSLISRTTGMTGIKQQFELLQALTISPHDEETAAARSDDNVGKNRFSDKVPSGRTRPFLMTEVEGGNDYINASFLPGYVSKNQYIGTQTPLPNTVIDFWRLVVDYKVNTIVMLHGNSRDKTYAQYWPTEGSKRYGPYTVDLLKEEYNRPIMHRTLEVTKMDSKKASSKKVKQLQLASCPPQSETPPTLADVMDLHRALLSALGTTVWKEGDSPLLIHCRDGEGMTGAFCAFLAALDHLDTKQTVDVFHACRKIRTSRPGAVASLAQYQFIYEAVKSFMISSSIYENMAKIV